MGMSQCLKVDMTLKYLLCLLVHFADCVDAYFVTTVCVESRYEAAGSNYVLKSVLAGSFENLMKPVTSI